MVNMMFLAVFVLFCGIYFLSLLVYIVGSFIRRKVGGVATKEKRVSIVVALKNEESRVNDLVKCLVDQDYPSEMYEIILVDDSSTDSTYTRLIKYVGMFPNLRVFSTRNASTNLRFKKAAIDLGIKNATGEIILITDADCIVGRKWVSGMVKYFQQGVGFVIGCSVLKHWETVFTKLQSLDFMMLMNASRATANLGIPWACNGHNIGFKRELYLKMGGFSEISHLVAGDDSVFMNIFLKRTGTKAVFAENRETWVYSEALGHIKDFILQRIRWAADANYMYRVNGIFFVVILSTFLVNLFSLILPVAALFWSSFLPYLAIGVAIKFVLEFLNCVASVKFFKDYNLLRYFPLWFIFEIPYIVLMGILSFWGNGMSWYRNRK